MSASDFYENKYLDAGLGNNRAPNMPATVYIKLFTAAPTDAGGGTEVVAGVGYSRLAVANNSTNWPDAVNSQKKNGVDFVFPQATGAWGTIVAFEICDAASGGYAMHWAMLSTAKPVAAGETPRFPANSIVITAD